MMNVRGREAEKRDCKFHPAFFQIRSQPNYHTWCQIKIHKYKYKDTNTEYKYKNTKRRVC